jgi:2Fe-2S ferredoxin
VAGLTQVTFIDAKGEVRTVDAPAGMSVADAALGNHVPGIEADCGGFCACGTCHVYLDEDWLAKVPAPDELEAAMLDSQVIDARPNSRLACQLKLSDALEGIVVHTPERQYL